MPVKPELASVSTVHANAISALSRDLVEAGLEHWFWTPKRVYQYIQESDKVGVVALRGGNLVGFALMHLTPPNGTLDLMAVSTDQQRTGVGRQMLSHLEAFATDFGVTELRLEHRASAQAAASFYQALGYQDCGHIEQYYCAKETAIRKQKQLAKDP